MTDLLLGAAVTLGVTAVLGPPVAAGLRRGHVLDHPNHRSSHSTAVPRGGGLAPAVGMVAGVLVVGARSGANLWPVAGAAVVFGVIGLVDDLRDLPAIPRLALQLVAGALAAWWLVPGGGTAVAVGALIAVWLVAYVNAYNFMDGINGIAASQAVVAGGLWLFVGEVRHVPVVAAAGALVAAAGIGFLPFNFPTARMFLGDVGSYFIGAWLAAVAVAALRAGIPFEAAVAPLAVFAFDTATTLAWRVARGERWYEAHRDHAYQRLIRGGWSHSATTGAATVAMTACALLGAVSLTGSMPLRVAADAALVAVLAGYVAAPALVAA